MGMVKRRIYPRDITINIGRGEPVPEHPYPGQKWKEVRQLPLQLPDQISALHRSCRIIQPAGLLLLLHIKSESKYSSVWEALLATQS